MLYSTAVADDAMYIKLNYIKAIYFHAFN